MTKFKCSDVHSLPSILSRTVRFHGKVRCSKRLILDQSTYSAYVNCWYSKQEYHMFKHSVFKLAKLLESNSQLQVDSSFNKTFFRGIERYQMQEKYKIKERRSLSHCIVRTLQDKPTSQMVHMLQCQSKECQEEAYQRALEDGKQAFDDTTSPLLLKTTTTERKYISRMKTAIIPPCHQSPRTMRCVE
jgi:hypothetical protein